MNINTHLVFIVLIALCLTGFEPRPSYAQIIPEGRPDARKSETPVEPMSTEGVLGLFELVANVYNYDLYCNFGVFPRNFIDNYYTLRDALFFRFYIENPEEHKNTIHARIAEIENEISREIRRLQKQEGCENMPEREPFLEFYNDFAEMEPEELVLRIEGNIGG